MKKPFSVKEIGNALEKAGRLKYEPLCIYGTDSPPNDAISSTELHFCIANAIIALSLQKEKNAIFFSKDTKRKSCPGSRAWLGYEPFNPYLKYFVSTGIKDFPAEHLVVNPEIAEKRLKSLGKLEPVGTYTVISKCGYVDKVESKDLKAIICFGQPEKIRNMCMLSYFQETLPYDLIQMPWGSSCGSFITYPCGLSENGPQNQVILGPMDPTDNYFFPPDILGMGIPIDIARKMAESLEESFIVKRETVAYPEDRADPEKEFGKSDMKEFSEKLFKAH